MQYLILPQWLFLSLQYLIYAGGNIAPWFQFFSNKMGEICWMFLFKIWQTPKLLSWHLRKKHIWSWILYWIFAFLVKSGVKGINFAFRSRCCAEVTTGCSVMCQWPHVWYPNTGNGASHKFWQRKQKNTKYPQEMEWTAWLSTLSTVWFW